MPPKKKQRVSSTAEPSTPSATAQEISNATDRNNDDAPGKILELEPELWADEEEISLFKGMIRWKPVGMHKRFRMISLSRHMRNHGHISGHTRPQGIWQKLDILYNMKVLDERENANIDDNEGDERYCEFNLPPRDFYNLMMSKRIDVERGSSPGWLDEPGDVEESSEEGSDEVDTSRASSVRGRRGARRGRGGRQARGGRGRGRKDSLLRDKTKVESGEDQDDEDEKSSDGSGSDHDEEDEEEDSEDSGEEENTTTQSNAARGTRGRGRGRGPRTRGRRGRKNG